MAGEPRVHVLAHPLDRAALARGVAALEQEEDALAVGARPGLHLHQLDLQLHEALLVLLAAHLLGHGEHRVAPLVERQLLQELGVEVVHSRHVWVGVAQIFGSAPLRFNHHIAGSANNNGSHSDAVR